MAQGRLELIAPVEMRLGKEAAIVFREGTTLSFDCDGFQEVDANIAFLLKSDKIHCVDEGGHNVGKLMFEARTQFSDFDDFFVVVNQERSFCFDGLDGFVFSVNNLVIDHSTCSTPPTAQFPSGYFGSADADESRRNWQGLAASKATVMLPDYMADKKADGAARRPVLRLENALIDGSGFSGSAAAEEVVSDVDVDPQSWDISVSDFQLVIDRNAVRGVGFGGKVNIPPLGENSRLDYVANYDVEQKTFVLQSSLGRKLDFPMLCAKLTLDETSTVTLAMGRDGICPTINANGLITVEVPIGKDTASSKLTLRDLRFEGMTIGRDRFDIGTVALAGGAEASSLAGFKLTLNDIRTVKNGDEQGLSIDAAVAVSEMFNGDASIALYGDKKSWKFSKVNVGKIDVNYKSQAFSIDGGVEFRDGDGVYGDGFRGELEFRLIDKFKFDAVGVFGHKDGRRYFFTDVLFETQPASGIQVPPALSFYGFGGGLYRHMRQSMKNPHSEFGKSLTGICYTPNENVGMGLLARTKFGLMGFGQIVQCGDELRDAVQQPLGREFRSAAWRGDHAQCGAPNVCARRHKARLRRCRGQERQCRSV